MWPLTKEGHHFPTSLGSGSKDLGDFRGQLARERGAICEGVGRAEVSADLTKGFFRGFTDKSLRAQRLERDLPLMRDPGKQFEIAPVLNFDGWGARNEESDFVVGNRQAECPRAGARGWMHGRWQHSLEAGD